MRERLDFVKLVLKHGANTELRDKISNTALHVAVQLNKPDIVVALLEHGADPNALDNAGSTSLCKSCGNPATNIGIVAALLEHGANPNFQETVQSYAGVTALHWAAQHNNAPAIKLLLEYGADKNIKSAVNAFAWQYTKDKNIVDLIKNAEVKPLKKPVERKRSVIMHHNQSRESEIRMKQDNEERRKQMEEQRAKILQDQQRMKEEDEVRFYSLIYRRNENKKLWKNQNKKE